MASLLFHRVLAAARDTRTALAEPLRQELERRLEAAELATPSVTSDSHDFCVSLLALVCAGPDPLSELSRLHVEDMYLVWALAKQDRAALARFEHEFLARLAVRVSEAKELSRGELEQQVRTRLFVSEQGQPARIRDSPARCQCP